jgi:endonuclease III
LKNAGDAQRLKQLLKQLERQVSVPETPERGPVEALVYAFLVWESSRRQADQAFPRLMKAVVDLNDLRVSDPAEVTEILGSKYPLAEDRAYRLKQALNSIYVREHAVDLSGLRSRPKREARLYLEELDGMVPFVAASVCLFCLGSHAMPVDEQLHHRLQRDGVVTAEATLEQTQSFLENQVRAGEATAVFHQLRAYVERPIKAELDKADGSSSKKAASSKSGGGSSSRSKKKTSAKTSKKKGSGGTGSRGGGQRAPGGNGSKSGGRSRSTKKSAGRGASGSRSGRK